MYQAQDSKQALKESLTDMKIRLDAYDNGNVLMFQILKRRRMKNYRCPSAEICAYFLGEMPVAFLKALKKLL